MELASNGKVKHRYIRGNDLVYSDSGNGTDKLYYVTDPHGNVVQLTDEKGNITRTYEYDSFGNEINPDKKDDNPFRYCGEYYDTETGEVYLRARYYQPELGRFMTRDTYTGEEDEPLSLHLYTYCENDGVNEWDPSGHKIVLIGDEEGKSVIFNNLKILTKAKLRYNKKTGNVKIKKYSTSKKYVYGDMLIRDLIKNKKTCKIETFNENNNRIKCDNWNDARNGNGTNVNVLFNPIFYYSCLVLYKGETKPRIQTNRPVYIGLGHELIHAVRAMKGIQSPQKIIKHDYIGEDGKKHIEEWYEEELETVGLVKRSSYYVNENDLRNEHGQPKRVKYKGEIVKHKTASVYIS